jgi:hypothetical protein
MARLGARAWATHKFLTRAIRLFDDAMLFTEPVQQGGHGSMSEKIILLSVRIPETQWERVEDWRRRQRKIPAMNEALRTLLERGLTTEKAKEKVA